MKIVKKNPMQRNVLVIAMVMDFMSPKTQPLLQAHFGSEKSDTQVALYPLQASDPEAGASSCSHVLEKFPFSGRLKSWAEGLITQPEKEQPIASIFHKIAFDEQFKLHAINHIIINTAIPKTDSCGQDVCQALSDLANVLKSERRKVIIQSLFPVPCPPFTQGTLTIEDASQRSLDQIVQLAQASDVSNAKQAKKQVAVASASQMQKTNSTKADSVKADSTGILAIIGPPLKVRLEAQGKVGTELRSPTKTKLAVGNWTVKISSPSWLKEIPEWKVQIQKDHVQTVNLREVASTQVDWIESSPDTDLFVVFSSGGLAPILIPKGSPVVPIPKGKTFKVYRMQ